jgi:hypothetical protein
MQCLAPFDPRDAGPPGVTTSKLPWFVGVAAAGAALAILALLNWRELIDTFHRHIVLQAELGVCAGTVVGLLLARMDKAPLMRRRLAKLDRLYEAAAGSPISVEPGYTHFLPCVLLRADTADSDVVANMAFGSGTAVLKDAVGGVLYVGPAGMQFQQSGECIAPQNEMLGQLPATPSTADRTFYMGAVREVTATSLALPQGWVTRATHAPPHYAMLVRWSAGQVVVAVPSIADTLARLNDCLDDLRWGRRVGN